MLEMLSRNSKNLLRTGVSLVLANLAQETLRQTSKDTVEELSRSIRRIKSNIKESKENRIRKAI